MSDQVRKAWKHRPALNLTAVNQNDLIRLDFLVLPPKHPNPTVTTNIHLRRSCSFIDDVTIKHCVINSNGKAVLYWLLDAPKVIVTPQRSRVKTGETVKFTCIASGSPSPDLTWRKVNGSLPVSSTVQRGVLKIASVTQKDAGSYNCEAKNVEGSANRSGTLEIKGKVSKGSALWK